MIGSSWRGGGGSAWWRPVGVLAALVTAQSAMAAGLAAHYAVWRLDGGVVGWALAAATAYGVLWFASERRAPLWVPVWFAAGLVATVLTLSSPLDTMGETVLLTMHMLEHMALTLVAAILLVAGIPQEMLERVRRLPGIGLVVNRFWNLTGMVLYSFVVLAWHVPFLYEAALRSEGIHDLEHLCFLLFAMLFWGPILRPLAPERKRSGAAFRRMVGVLIALALNTVLGSYLFFVQHVLYPSYAGAPRVWGLIDVLTDQSIAGGSLWVMGDMAYIVATVVLVAQWMQSQTAPAVIRRPVTE